MNKAQDVIDKIKRHRFWILCGLVAVGGVVSWWFSTSTLAKEYAANKAKIESAAGKITTVQGVVPHPNEKWEVALKAGVEKDRKEVEKAWQRLYSEQKSKVYVWPADIFGQDFVDAVQNLPPDGTLEPVFLNRYWNNVLAQFKGKLAVLVDADYVDPSQASGGGYGREGAAAAAAATQLLPGQVPKKLIWNGQPELQTPYVWAEAPETIEVLYAQEEIWVIQALCQAIAMANEGSTGPHDSIVQTIEQMMVGYEAAEEYPNGEKELGRITKVKAQAVAAGGGYGGSGYGGSGYGGSGATAADSGAPASPDAALGTAGGALSRPPRPDRVATGGSKAGYGGVGGSDTAAAPVSAVKSEYLNEWRYVGPTSAPLRAADLATPPFYEYRLMPWRLRMTVDDRKWDRLLVMFRNTAMPLEIRQVRVNPADDGGMGGSGGRYGNREGGSGGGRGGYGASAGGGGRGGYGGTGASRGGYGAGRESPFGGAVTPTNNMILELRGVAYLINPPDFSKIGVAGAPAATADASPVTATPAAVAPADPNDIFALPPGSPAAAPAAPPTLPGQGQGGAR